MAKLCTTSKKENLRIYLTKRALLILNWHACDCRNNQLVEILMIHTPERESDYVDVIMTCEEENKTARKSAKTLWESESEKNCIVYICLVELWIAITRPVNNMRQINFISHFTRFSSWYPFANLANDWAKSVYGGVLLVPRTVWVMTGCAQHL